MRLLIQLIKAVYLLSISSTVNAGDVNVVSAELTRQDSGLWKISVTLRHDDTGWEHFADLWQVVDNQGNVLGSRILQHPHVNEQPFRRALFGVEIPENLDHVYIKAHDNVHGWSDHQLKIDLEKVKNNLITHKPQ